MNSQIAFLAALGAAALAASPAAASSDIGPAQFAPLQMPGLHSALAADPPRQAPAHGRRDRDRQSIYDDRGRYRDPRRLGRRDRIWRGRDGNYYCERGNGTTGLVIGAGLGALAGRAIDTEGDRTAGTLLGAIAGGLLGQEIDRGELRCR